jgi:hypothetical protein
MTVRHRRGCGGDRAPSPAIHAIALVRVCSCPGTRTHADVARRAAAGFS